MSEILLHKWGSPVITGDRVAEKPPMIGFKHYSKGLDMLKKHIDQRSLIGIHVDVDGDGIGCGYILDRFLLHNGIGKNQKMFMINKEKVHGISQKYVEYLNTTPVQLVIVADSSCNELEVIKQLNCDVIVVDHHEILHEELYGETAGGNFVIITNMVSNYDLDENWLAWRNFHKSSLETWAADENMSCGLVLYEFLRLYCYFNGQEKLLENAQLYQWVTFTLFTDSISMKSMRNQWYAEQTMYGENTEHTLYTMITALTKYKNKLDKTLINYTLAPMINRGIRAGSSTEVLNIVLDRPADIMQLAQYREVQDIAISSAYNDVEHREKFVMRDITNTGISKNYCGVMANKLMDYAGKSAVVYVIDRGVAKGSFRGKIGNFDYRTLFANDDPEVYAQGHGPAFGFKILETELERTMERVMVHEPKLSEVTYLTAGILEPELRGQYHIEDLKEFMQQGNLYRMAIGNAKVSSSESIKIVCSIAESSLEQNCGKIFNYRCLGVPCKAFSELTSNLIALYPEYVNGKVEIYAENIT